MTDDLQALITAAQRDRAEAEDRWMKRREMLG